MEEIIFYGLMIGISIIFVVYFIYWFWALFTSAPYYPSNKKAIQFILQLLKENDSEKVVELGSGDGRIAKEIALNGYEITAVEMNPLLTVVSRIKKAIFRLDKLNVKQSDLFKEDFSSYDTVVMYLYPHLMKRLEPVLFKEMKKGSTIVSNTFQFKNRKPDKVLGEKVYLYKV